MMQTDYRPDDKDWVKQRKANWKYVKKSIKQHLAFTRPVEYPGMRDYYLTGEMNQTVVENRCTPLFELWLHPDTSEARWEGIWQDLLTRYSGTNTSDELFITSQREFFRAAGGSYCDPEFGVFGGMEERLLKFFLPIDAYTDETFVIENREQRLCYWLNPTKAYILLASSFERFLTRDSQNIYDYCQYLLDFWFSCFDHELDYDYAVDSMRLVYQTIYQSSRLSDAELHPVKLAFAKKLADALDSRPLPEPVQALWSNAKS